MSKSAKSVSPLGKFRVSYNTVFAVGSPTEPNAKVAEVALTSYSVTSPNGEETVRLVLPALPIEAYQFLGHIAARWPILEIYIDEMTRNIARSTGGDPEMKGIYNWKRRLRYHKDQFQLCFSHLPETLKYHEEVMKIVERTKRVRDKVGHAPIVCRPEHGEFKLKFVDHSVRGRREKWYTSEDLMKSASDISHACGFIEALATTDPSVLRLPSHEIFELRKVLDKDRWNRAICKILKIPPPPSQT